MNEWIKIEGIYSNVVNFAMQQNDVPIVKKLIVKNDGEEDIKRVQVVLSVEPEFAHEWSTTVESIPAHGAVDIDGIDLHLSPTYLYGLTEKVLGSVSVVVRHKDDVLAINRKAIDVLAYDEWSGTAIMPEIVAAFITPNHPSIAKILQNASPILEKWSDSPSFTGYQSNNPNTVKLQMAAIYTALQNEAISYCVPPTSYEVVGQRIRLCDNILKNKMGTCLDLTLLYASCLEAIGLSPLIVFMKGHAFLGCWLENECFSECVQDDVSMISKRIAEGIHEICLVESTAFVAGKTVAFDEAVRLGNAHLLEIHHFEFIVDVKRSRGSGIRPMPLIQDIKELLPENVGSTNSVQMAHAPMTFEVHNKIEQVSQIEVTKQRIWERKLLDLSLRNTLVNFRVTKTALQLMVNQLSELEDALSSGQEFQLMAKPKDFDNTLRDSKIFELHHQSSIIETLIKTEFASKRIRTFIDEGEVVERMTALYRQAKVSLEENGTNTLYLALGFLKWYESDVSEKERHAPIVLIPIDVVRKSAQKGYVIRIRDEEPQMNITLIEMLRQDFGLNIGGLDPLPMDESGVDLKGVFSAMRQAVMSKSRWDVEEAAFIGLFSFSQFIMWNDIRNRAGDLMNNKIVKSLMSGKVEWDCSEQFPDISTLDQTFKPIDLAVPISADSSQLSAICAAGKGQSFVLHGPPGTGKSQTITNIIANALFQGQSVLFIAEKMAALSVVQRRLEGIGLAPFCLELHSNKARKKDVLDQLEKVLEIGKTAPPEQYNAQAQRLLGLRGQLNEVVEAIHKKRTYGFSLYEAITRFECHREDSEATPFSQVHIMGLTPEKYADWVDLVTQLQIIGKTCGGAYEHPLREITSCIYSQDMKANIGNALRTYAQQLTELKDLFTKVSQLPGMGHLDSFDQLTAATQLLSVVKGAEFIPPKLWMCTQLSILKDEVTLVCASGEKRDALEEKLKMEFIETILTYDAVAATQEWRLAQEAWFLPKMLGKAKVKKSLKMLSKNPKDFKGDKIPEYLEQITQFKFNGKIVQEHHETFSDLFGLLWQQSGGLNGKSKWQTLQKAFTDAAEGDQQIAAIAFNGVEAHKVKEQWLQEVLTDLNGFKQRYSETIEGMHTHWRVINEIENKLNQTAGIPFALAKKSDLFILQMSDVIQRWLGNLEGLRDWCAFLNIKARLEDAGLTHVVAAYEGGLIGEEQLLSGFYRGVSQACSMEIVNSEKCLSDFNGAIFEDLIAKFSKTSTDFENLTKDELIARLSAKIPSASLNSANSSEIGILQKAIRSGGRMISIRKLFDGIPHLLRLLCPCMLMSPISVAQYIDPKYPPFDLVIFDEASQLPTSEAVGAIARGKNVIVVGDPKQLPPTSFFSTNQVDEDNYEKEDLESILDDCMALSMPQSHLLWHYRSRHESLIAFSNMQYYDNKLYTFPSPRDLVSSVTFVPVEGFYDRGRTKHNKAEAEAVIAEIVRRLSDPILCKESIGVVTFSAVQQNLIDDLLTKTFIQNPALEEINNAAYEPIFIKNLENVQGDERDIILFSIGYGPDETGKTALNFGPINRDGGWRRLNVAVSRARKEMKVFSTLRPEHIDISKTRSQGVAGLRAFLEYAQKGKSSLAFKLSNAAVKTEMAEKRIAEKLMTLGYEVHTNIGASEYKIDIGIVHPYHKGEYLLGVMCDGDNYKASKTARDRNILQEGVLKSLGWCVHRLWMLDWWENPDKEVEKIRLILAKQIEKAADGVKEVPAQTPIRETYVYKKLVATEADSAEALPTYEICSLETETDGGLDAFCLPKNTKKILKQINRVMAVEAPISENLLHKRLQMAWGITRSGARLENRMKEVLEGSDFQVTSMNNALYYWKKDQLIEAFHLFRVPANEMTRRNMEDIAVTEIVNAIVYIVKNQISLSKIDLIREVYRLFGFSRSSTTIEACVGAALDLAESKKAVVVDGENIRIV